MRVRNCSNTRQKTKKRKQTAAAAAEISDDEDVALEMIVIGLSFVFK